MNRFALDVAGITSSMNVSLEQYIIYFCTFYASYVSLTCCLVEILEIRVIYSC